MNYLEQVIKFYPEIRIIVEEFGARLTFPRQLPRIGLGMLDFKGRRILGYHPLFSYNWGDLNLLFKLTSSPKKLSGQTLGWVSDTNLLSHQKAQYISALVTDIQPTYRNTGGWVNEELIAYISNPRSLLILKPSITVIEDGAFIGYKNERENIWFELSRLIFNSSENHPYLKKLFLKDPDLRENYLCQLNLMEARLLEKYTEYDLDPGSLSKDLTQIKSDLKYIEDVMAILEK